MKKQTFFAIGLIIIVCGLAWYSITHVLRNGSELPIPVENNNLVQEQLIIGDSYTLVSVGQETDYAVITGSYPVFAKASKDFNDTISRAVVQSIQEHAKNARENWNARFDTEVSDNISKKPTTEDKLPLQFDTTIIQSNNQFISYMITQSGYEGGAHGYSIIFSGAYDVVHQKLVTLADMFPDDSNYLTKISTITRNELIKQYTTVSPENNTDSSGESVDEYSNTIKQMIIEGTEPTTQNFKTFTFTPDTITIYFQQYQVGPYSIGMPTVTIPRT